MMAGIFIIVLQTSMAELASADSAEDEKSDYLAYTLLLEQLYLASHTNDEAQGLKTIQENLAISESGAKTFQEMSINSFHALVSQNSQTRQRFLCQDASFSTIDQEERIAIVDAITQTNSRKIFDLDMTQISTVEFSGLQVWLDSLKQTDLKPASLSTPATGQTCQQLASMNI